MYEILTLIHAHDKKSHIWLTHAIPSTPLKSTAL